MSAYCLVRYAWKLSMHIILTEHFLQWMGRQTKFCFNLCMRLYVLYYEHCNICIVFLVLYSMHCIFFCILYIVFYPLNYIIIISEAFHYIYCVLKLLFFALCSMHCNLNMNLIPYNVLYALNSVHWSHWLGLYAWYYMNGIPCIVLYCIIYIVFYAFNFIHHISCIVLFAFHSMLFHRSTITALNISSNFL